MFNLCSFTSTLPGWSITIKTEKFHHFRIVFFYDFFVSFAMKLLYKYLIIISINLICYYRSIDGDFVFDDSVAILKNRDVYEGEFNRKTFEVGNEGKFGTKLKFFGNF